MAANTGIIDGGDILVYVNTGTVLSPTWTPVAHCTECSISHSTEIRKRMTKDTGKSSEKKAAEQTTTINVSALRTYGAYNYFDLRAIQLAGTEVQLKYSGRPAADLAAGLVEVAEQVGDKYEEGMFIITSLDSTDAKNADSTMKATFENSGLPEVKTVAAP
jgi:hypothetical protein